MGLVHVSIGSMKNLFTYDDSLGTPAMDTTGPISAGAASLGEHLVRKQEADLDYASGLSLSNHISNTSNPHNVTLTQVAGLSGTPISGTFNTGSTLPGTLASLVIENGIITGATLVP